MKIWKHKSKYSNTGMWDYYLAGWLALAFVLFLIAC